MTATRIHLVRLQHVLEEIDLVSSNPDSFDTSHSGRAFQHTFRTFNARIQDYSNFLPPKLTTNCEYVCPNLPCLVLTAPVLLATQLHTVNLYLCQVSLFDRKATTQLPVDMRSEILCHGLVAAKSSFASFATIGAGSKRHFSYSQWLQSGFSLIVSCKLALMVLSDKAVRDNFPQVQALCDALDMPGVLRIYIGCQDQHSSQRDPAPPATGFDYKGWLQLTQEWFLRQYNGYLARQEVAGGAVTAASSNPAMSQAYLGIDKVSAVDLQLPFCSHITLWGSFPDLLVADNPLVGWMDWG